jgi:hypothetical protein
MKKDIKFLSLESLSPELRILGSTKDEDTMLIQRVLVSFCSVGSMWRFDGAASCIDMLGSRNMPSAGQMTAMLTQNCIAAYNALDADDRKTIAEITANIVSLEDDRLAIEVEAVLTDGRTLTGVVSGNVI